MTHTPTIRVAIITLFPDLITSYFQSGVVTRAADCGLELFLINLRDFGQGPHQKVDDRPYGGGPGMVLRADVLYQALKKAQQYCPQGLVVAFAPTGKLISQELLRSFVPNPQENKELILICGRYEGFDQRFIDLYVDQSWSLGPFVLSGGEIPAMACLDGIARLLPGVLNCQESAQQDSFSALTCDYPHYTRPEIFEGVPVPDILTSGNHQKIAQWRHQKSLEAESRWRQQ
jgi:tRNA (guanine37-N1)-methyltransferase